MSSLHITGIILICLLLPGLHVSVPRHPYLAHIYDPHVAKHFFLTVNQVIFGNNKFEWICAPWKIQEFVHFGTSREWLFRFFFISIDLNIPQCPI